VTELPGDESTAETFLAGCFDNEIKEIFVERDLAVSLKFQRSQKSQMNGF